MTFREITHDVLGLTSISLKPMLDNGKDTGILFAMFMKNNSRLIVYADAHVIHCMDAATRNDLQYEDKTHNGIRAVYITGLKTVVEKVPHPYANTGKTSNLDGAGDDYEDWEDQTGDGIYAEPPVMKEPSNAQYRRYASDAFPKQRYKF